MLTEDQWKKIDDKYGKLMYKISHQISGDEATATFDDNLQDIRIAALEAVNGFIKQNDGANGSFDDFWGSKGFDQYIKTCMWTKKNNKGSKITKKAPILKGTVSTEMEEVLNIEDAGIDPDASLWLEEVSYLLTPTQKEIVTLVTQDPTLIKPSGRINVKQVADTLGLTWFETDKHIRQLSNALENEF